jgi:hypothetical protein
VESTGAPGGDDGLDKPMASLAASSRLFAALSVSVNVADEFTPYTLRHFTSFP